MESWSILTFQVIRIFLESINIVSGTSMRVYEQIGWLQK